MLMHAFSSKGGGGGKGGQAPLVSPREGLKFSKKGQKNSLQGRSGNRAPAASGRTWTWSLHSITAHATPQANPLKLINLHITDIQ